jgi:hypothetical protein
VHFHSLIILLLLTFNSLTTSGVSRFKSFTLFSFNYACTNSIPADACGVVLTGTTTHGSVMTKGLYFPAVPSGVTAEQAVMNNTVLDGWSNLVDVGFETYNFEIGWEWNGSLMIDDLVYQTFQQE